jgi:hypothetical protein
MQEGLTRPVAVLAVTYASLRGGAAWLGKDQGGGPHGDLMAAIGEALDGQPRLSRIARHAGWTTEYIAKIRDGKTRA